MKVFLFSGLSIESLFANIFFTLSRVSVGLMMAFGHGLGKLPPSPRFVGFLTKLGFPLPEIFAWSAGLTEFLFAIFLALGLMTRLSSALLIFTMAVAAFVAHAADPFAKKEMALLYLMTFVVFLALGAGKFSLDAIIRKRS